MQIEGLFIGFSSARMIGYCSDSAAKLTDSVQLVEDGTLVLEVHAFGFFFLKHHYLLFYCISSAFVQFTGIGKYILSPSTFSPALLLLHCLLH